MPIAWAVWITRRAISPRLATSSFFMGRARAPRPPAHPSVSAAAQVARMRDSAMAAHWSGFFFFGGGGGPPGGGGGGRGPPPPGGGGGGRAFGGPCGADWTHAHGVTDGRWHDRRWVRCSMRRRLSAWFGPAPHVQCPGRLAIPMVLAMMPSITSPAPPPIEASRPSRYMRATLFSSV